MKSFWLSKTLWTNLFAAVAIFVQNEYGYVVSPELQAYGLVLVNLALRFVTSKPII